MVRPFRRRDLKRVAAIEQESFGADAWPEEAFLDYFRQCPELFLIARQGREVAGYTITYPGSRGAELVSIAVDRRYRRSGVGRALLDATLSLLRSRGIGVWWLMVDTVNESAIRFYAGYGFARTRLVKSYYGPDRDAWRMRRRV